jgi:hypothetical protein
MFFHGGGKSVAATAPAQTMAWKKPAPVNPGNRRRGASAELAHYLGRISSPAQVPAIRQRRSLKKTGDVRGFRAGGARKIGKDLITSGRSAYSP